MTADRATDYDEDLQGTPTAAEAEAEFKRDGPKTFTHGRAGRAAARLEKELESLRDQNAPDSTLVTLEAIIVGLLEFEQRNRPIDHEKLAAEVLATIRAGRDQQ
jgi:hypothetical protein